MRYPDAQSGPGSDPLDIGCTNCALRSVCLPGSLGREDAGRFDSIVERPDPLPRGRHVFRAGTPFTSLYAVRSGVVATRTTQCHPGIAQVTNFYLPGEVLGFVGICEDEYQNDAIVLERAIICEIPFDALQRLGTSVPALQQRLTRLMSRMVTHQELFHNAVTTASAIERVVLFLLDTARRRGQAGLPTSDLRLPLSRREVGDFLGLALETVSRSLARLANERLIVASRRRIRILDPGGLAQIAGCEKAAERLEGSSSREAWSRVDSA